MYDWSPRNLARGIGQVGKWLGYALRCVILQRDAYAAVVQDGLMTGPALLIGVLTVLLSQLIRIGSFDLLRLGAAVGIWFLAVLLVFATGWLLTRRGNFTQTLRALGFAQSVYFLSVFALYRPTASIVQAAIFALGFLAVWMGAAAAHKTSGWRTLLLLPVVVVVVSVVGTAVVAMLLAGVQFTQPDAAGAAWSVVSAARAVKQITAAPADAGGPGSTRRRLSMARVSTLVDVLSAHQVDDAMVAQVCVDLVASWSGGMSGEEMYRDLMANATDAAAVDQMLYQLKGDALYAENAALIVLSAAWNYHELETQIRDIGAAVAALPRTVSNLELGGSILYGMYLMARAGAKIQEVAYADPEGNIHLRKFDGGVDAGDLFDGVRNQYGITL